jgi:hypothetical protein
LAEDGGAGVSEAFIQRMRALARVSKDERYLGLMVRDGAPDSANALQGTSLLTMRRCSP